MRGMITFFLFAVGAGVLVSANAALAGDPNTLAAGEKRQGFVLLFDGKTLDGWDGDPRVWRVDDGAIVGSSDNYSPEHNTFLVYKAPYTDFVLKAEVKLRNGNSGIQFRSKLLPDWIVHGYQADLSFAGERSAWGNFYEEKGRGRGVMPAPSVGWEKAKNIVRAKDWNQYEIYAKGSHIRLTLNGVVTIDTHDDKTSSGVIGFQLHTGDPMEVRFRGIKIKPLIQP